MTFAWAFCHVGRVVGNGQLHIVKSSMQPGNLPGTRTTSTMSDCIESLHAMWKFAHAYRLVLNWTLRLICVSSYLWRVVAMLNWSWEYAGGASLDRFYIRQMSSKHLLRVHKLLVTFLCDLKTHIIFIRYFNRWNFNKKPRIMYKSLRNVNKYLLIDRT